MSSAKTLRPTLAAWRWASSLSLVYLPCLRLAPEIFFRPSVVLAPVDRPPCKLHLPLCLKAGRWHGVPFRVLAKHLLPGQLGPKRVGRPNSEICFATVKNTPFIGYLRQDTCQWTIVDTPLYGGCHTVLVPFWQNQVGLSLFVWSFSGNQ